MPRPEGCARPYYYYIARREYDFVCGHYDAIVTLFIITSVAQIVVPLILSLIGNYDCCQSVTRQGRGANDQQQQYQLIDRTSNEVSTPQPAFVRNHAMRRFLYRWLQCISLSGQITVWFWFVVFITSLKWSARIISASAELFVAILMISSLITFCLAMCILYQSIYSRELKYFDNIEPLSTVCQLVDQYGIAEPVLTMTAECYHYDVTSYYDGSAYGGRGAWRTQRRKVVTSTHTSKCDFPFWSNVTPPLDLASLRATRKVAKVKVNMTILVGDTATFHEFNSQYTQFQTQHRHHDKHVDYDVIEETHAFKQRMVAVPEGVDVPWWMNKVCFYISACLTLGWVYHLVSWCTTNTFEYHVVKKVYVSRPSNAGNFGSFVSSNHLESV